MAVVSEQQDSRQAITAFLNYFDRGGTPFEFGKDLARPGGRIERANAELAKCQTRKERRQLLRRWPGFAEVYHKILRSMDEAMIEGEVRIESVESD